jgi:hypothetical protein
MTSGLMRRHINRRCIIVPHTNAMLILGLERSYITNPHRYLLDPHGFSEEHMGTIALAAALPTEYMCDGGNVIFSELPNRVLNLPSLQFVVLDSTRQRGILCMQLLRAQHQFTIFVRSRILPVLRYAQHHDR